MNWMGKAQQRLQENAEKLFKQWLETKDGQNWMIKWSRKPSKMHRLVSNIVPQNSPYGHGFSLPQYHHDLIKAVGNNDEELAKYLMLTHFLDRKNV